MLAAACGPATTAPPTKAEAPAASKPPPRRFDQVVSTDLFAGFGGDAAAFARGMQATEAALADNPLDPQPLIWHAMATGWLGGQAYLHGDEARGHELVGQSDREAEQAVRLARRGNQASARGYLARAARELPGTIYASKAQDWLDGRAQPSPKHGYTCLGCHEP